VRVIHSTCHCGKHCHLYFGTFFCLRQFNGDKDCFRCLDDIENLWLNNQEEDVHKASLFASPISSVPEHAISLMA